MRTSEGQRSSDMRTGSRVPALAGITVALAFLVFSGSAFASAPPSIDSESASDVTVHDATLEAKINPHGAYTGYEFQIDTSSSYNYTKPNCPLGSCDSISVGAFNRRTTAVGGDHPVVVRGGGLKGRPDTGQVQADRLITRPRRDGFGRWLNQPCRQGFPPIRRSRRSRRTQCLRSKASRFRI
jgi:hypothetical protein